MATFAERLLILREATVSTLIRMADYFGVSIDYLVGRTDSP